MAAAAQGGGWQQLGVVAAAAICSPPPPRWSTSGHCHQKGLKTPNIGLSHKLSPKAWVNHSEYLGSLSFFHLAHFNYKLVGRNLFLVIHLYITYHNQVCDVHNVHSQNYVLQLHFKKININHGYMRWLWKMLRNNLHVLTDIKKPILQKLLHYWMSLCIHLFWQYL